MSSLNKHRLYGRRLTDDSLAQIARDVFVHLRRASTEEIDDAIKVIQGRGATEKTTCSTISTVLCLLTRPNELSRLQNTGMLSACVSLLRTYGNQTSGKLFSYEYGHLCYQLLTVIIEVGILLHTRRFEAFAQQASQFPDPFTVYLMLASKAVRTVDDGFQKGETRATRDWLFGITGWGPDRVFLPEVGGFRNKDLAMFLDMMWQDQDTFSKICINTPTAGWSLALFAMESHLQVDILDHAGERPDIWNTFARLVTLSFRYSLVARGQESDVIQDVYIRSHFAMVRFVGECYHRPPFVSSVDLHDARTVVGAYIQRSTPARGENPLFIEVVIASIPLIFGEALHGLEDLIPPLFNVMLSRLRAEIVDEEPSSTFDEDWQVKTAHYSVCVLKSIEDIFEVDYKFNKETMRMLVRALVEQDYINLIGRVILLPMETVPSHGHRTRNPTATFLGCWARIIEQFQSLSLKMESTTWPVIGIFSKSYEDWNKVLAFIRSQQSAHRFSRGHPYQKYIESLEMSWDNLGTAMNYMMRPKAQKLCGYPRCADPEAIYWDDGVHLVCMGCLEVGYCSKTCQSAHKNEHITVCVPGAESSLKNTETQLAKKSG